jgi:hypothetical protein
MRQIALALKGYVADGRPMAIFQLNESDRVDLEIPRVHAGQKAVEVAITAHRDRAALVEHTVDSVRFLRWWNGPGR